MWLCCAAQLEAVRRGKTATQGDTMFKDATHRLSELEKSEQEVRRASSAQLGNLLQYFRFLQETVLTALHNSGKPIPISTEKNNPILFAFITTTRSIGVAKAAMDLATSGHPFEAIALSRVLTEIAECTQYLVRHPQLIDRFISGSLKFDQVLKSSKSEKPKGSPYPYGHLRGIQSQFAHASPNLLVLALSIDGPSLSSPIVVSNLTRIEEAAHGIATALLTQYVIFRITLQDALEPLELLAQRDALLFNPEHIREFLTSETMPGELLASIRQALTEIRRA